MILTRIMLVTALVASSACSSHTTFKTTRPVGKANHRFLVASQVHGSGPEQTGKALMPELAMSARYGLLDDLDLHGNLSLLPLGRAFTTVSAELVVQKHLWTSSGERFELAVAAGAGYRYAASSGAPFEGAHVAVPVIFGINFGSSQLAISPTVGWQRWYSDGANPVDIPFAGLSLGFDWRAWQRWSILPEISVSRSPTELTGMGPSQLVHVGVALVRH